MLLYLGATVGQVAPEAHASFGTEPTWWQVTFLAILKSLQQLKTSTLSCGTPDENVQCCRGTIKAGLYLIN